MVNNYYYVINCLNINDPTICWAKKPWHSDFKRFTDKFFSVITPNMKLNRIDMQFPYARSIMKCL